MENKQLNVGDRVRYIGRNKFLKGLEGIVESVTPPLIINGVTFSEASASVNWDNNDYSEAIKKSDIEAVS